MNTQDLHSILIQETPNYLEDLTPFREYTEQEISQATYIYINHDDQQWRLGFENQIPLELAYYNSPYPPISYNNLPLFIY